MHVDESITRERGSVSSCAEHEPWPAAQAVASELVSTRIARNSPGTTWIEVKNRLPFTLANIALRAGRATDAPVVDFKGVGFGPARAMLAPVSSKTGVIDRIELNGL